MHASSVLKSFYYKQCNVSNVKENVSIFASKTLLSTKKVKNKNKRKENTFIYLCEGIPLFGQGEVRPRTL